MARTCKISFMADEKVKQELDEMAENLGITVSALCAYVIGNFLYQQRGFVKPLASQFQNLVVEQAKKALEATQAPERSEASGA